MTTAPPPTGGPVETSTLVPVRPSAHRRTGSLMWLSILSPIVVVALWQLSAAVGWLDQRYFPSPWNVLVNLKQFAQSGALLENLAPTMKRLVIGMLLGGIPGVIIGLLMGYQRVIRAIVQPLVDLTFPIPKVAVFPLLLLIFGLGERATYVAIAISVIFLVLINACDGVRNLQPIYWDVGHDCGASRWMIFKDIALPGALPQTLTGIRLATNVALLVVVATEFVGSASNKGMGFVIWNSWNYFQVQRMYAGLIVLAIVGVTLSIALRSLERLLVPWMRRTR